MSVLSAVTRAMRSGRVISPNEFPAIQREALASIDLSQMQPGDYLLRGEGAEALRGARFRNEAERRTFFVSFLHQARDQVLVQLNASLSAIPEEDRAESLSCFEVSGEAGSRSYTPAACFFRGAIGFGLSRGRESVLGGVGFSSGFLRYLGEALPARAFLGLQSDSDQGFFEIQLLDGVMFNRENFGESELPVETRIHASTLRLIYRANLCSDTLTLPDCAD